MNTKTLFESTAVALGNLHNLAMQILQTQENFRRVEERIPKPEGGGIYLLWLVNLAPLLGVTDARAHISLDSVCCTCRVAIDQGGFGLFAGEKKEGSVSMENSFRDDADTFLKCLSRASTKILATRRNNRTMLFSRITSLKVSVPLSSSRCNVRFAVGLYVSNELILFSLSPENKTIN